MSDDLKGRWIHYKGGWYIVEGVAKHSETLEEMVVYRNLHDTTKLWVRPKEMFLGTVTPEGATTPVQRFTRYEQATRPNPSPSNGRSKR